MALRWRAIREAELDACLEVRPACRGESLIGREAAQNVWRLLLGHSAFRHAAIESDPPVNGHRIVGFGASVFVTPEFAGRELANPQPDINSRILESVHAGRPVLLTRDQIGVANAGHGLDSVFLYGTPREDILDAPQLMEATVLSAQSILGCHAGYRLRRILQERVCPYEQEMSDESGVFRRHAEFPDAGRILYTTSRDDVAHAPGTVGQMVFVYHEPVLRLRESEQELLEASLSGGTDDELAAALGLSLTAVKARWRAIFSRLSEWPWSDAGVEHPTVPPSLSEIFMDGGAAENASGRAARGGQKRHRLVEYVRHHPEELRPYAWNLGQATASAE